MILRKNLVEAKLFSIGKEPIPYYMAKIYPCLNSKLLQKKIVFLTQCRSAEIHLLEGKIVVLKGEKHFLFTPTMVSEVQCSRVA